eukprot:jgi/Ulvmu1/6675/UM030_0006.1
MEISLTHIKERYRSSMADRSMSIHATLAEMLGTGIVVLVGTSATQFSQDALDLTKAMTGSPFNDPVSVLSLYLLNAVVFGMIYFAVTCATRHHGGAHLNPAITVASFLAGVTPLLQAVLLIVAQIVGAILASAIVLGLVFEDDRDHSLIGANVYRDRPGMSQTRALGVEIIGTFVLAYIFLQTFTHPRSEHRAVAPLAVGLAYTAILTATAPYSSASLNPARTLGPAAVSGKSDSLWIWIIGPLIGAIIAVPMHLISVSHLPEFDSEGRVKRNSAIGAESTMPQTGKAVAV